MNDLTIQTADDFASRFLEARKGGSKIEAAEMAGFPAAAKDAYRTQELVLEALGPAGAFKTVRKPGVTEQIAAPIFSRSVKASPAEFSAAEIDMIGVELEIGFRVNEALPDPSDPDFETLVRQRISPVAAIEVCDTRLADYKTASDAQKLADNQLNGGLVTGTPRDDWQGFDVGTVNAKLVFGTETVLDGPAKVPGGDAFQTFLGLARQLGNHCGGLQPGQYVITGSLNGMPLIERGTPVRGWIEGLGEVSADFPV